MFKKCLVLLAVLGLAGVASANSYWSFFNNSTGDGLWSTAANWDPGVVPTETNCDYAAGMCYGSTTMLTIDGEANVKNLITGVWGAKNDVTVTSTGNLTIYQAPYTGCLSIGEAASAATTSVVTNNGTIYAAGQFFVGGTGATGYGTYVQNEGATTTLDWRFYISQHGSALINGGTLTAGYLAIDAGGKMNFAGDGQLYFGYDSADAATALCAQYIADGRFTATGGQVMYAFDGDLNQMRVWATPEPMTMVLLGLGGLFLRRKSS